ncbi:MAG: response regulator [Lachnospiraceae bacterium]|nr:response regulator [Lachnospiraceae bacterium]
MAERNNKKTERPKEYGNKKNSMVIPLILIFIFVTVMVVYTSKLIYSVAVLNSNAVIEDRMKNVSSLVDNHLNTAENVLQITADSVQHMLISGSTPARIHEFLVEETDNVTEQFGENYHGFYGYIMSRYMDGLNWEPPEDYDPKSRDWYIVAQESNGDVKIVPPYVDAQTGNLIISVCRMLPDRQNIISLDVQLNGIQSMMKELTINGKGYGFIIDEAGLVIAHSDESLKGTDITGTPGGEDLLNAIKSKGTGSFSYTMDGSKNTVFVNGILNNWYVVMVMSDNELYGEVKSQLVVTVFICTLVFIMIAIFYYVGHKNEQSYAKDMEELKLEEQKAAYERKVLELEKDAANASNKAKSDFLANMSHEIRTPMNAIIGMDEMILRSSKDDSVRKYALNIQSAGKTLLSIINDILDLSKIESGKMELIQVKYGFSSVMNDVVNMTRNKADEKGLRYKINVSEDIPSVLMGDEIRIRQIMLNLINNAIKYTDEGSVSIDVSFDKDNSKLKVIVTDTGIGIKDEDLGKLFDSFQRLEEDRNRNIEGTGLGLNITMRLVKMMGGNIRVSSVYGAGTKFTAEMLQEVVDDTPVGDFAANLSKMQDAAEEFKPLLIAPNAKILIVDDNEMNLDVISDLLSDTRIRVTTAQSGRECIIRLREGSFDVVLLDQMMPGMSGIQTLEAIRRDHLADGTPIIALTADAIVGARDSYIREGFTDYLSKPVMYKDLEEALLKYISKDLLITQEEADRLFNTEKAAEAFAEEAKDRETILVISSSTDKLNAVKELLGSRYKGVFVKDEEKAAKYLEKHEVAFIIRDAG